MPSALDDEDFKAGLGKRRASEGFASGGPRRLSGFMQKQGPDTPAGKWAERSLKKAMTMAAPAKVVAASRDSVAALSGESIAHLHQLNEEYKKKEAIKAGERITNPAELMDKCWGGQERTWTIYGKFPSPSTEDAYNIRDFTMRPAVARPAEWLNQCGVAAVNTKGCKDPDDTSLGQDNFSVSLLSGGWEAICCMDGHGGNGHWPSTRAVRAMPYFLSEKNCMTMLNANEGEAALRHAFMKTQEDMERWAWREEVNLQACGCTAVCCLKNSSRHQVWVAWCGDSRTCVIAPKVGVVKETNDHKPSDKKELARIEANGGEVTRGEYDDGTEEARIFVKGKDYPGILMTRSLGDLVCKDIGVIAIPEVSCWDLTGIEGAMLLTASDGVWEFLETQEVAELVLDSLAQGRSREESVEELLEVARQSWIDNEDEYCDDITAVLVDLSTGLKAIDADATEISEGCAAGICKNGCSIL
eukprot:gnl/TRDRNA2_/TRDRNA2_188302_c0_seq1.p1 gnl/TRDRNA2_/TRDRNA2_188302_c0~~gnl/TRDRNA2_/TRDRNA2_188302_c0_seq1.p1  ORF type:complete len:472 (+),score=100.56 gnl/TRDRNA2_/TRDRNA2_188302_c0_seq1:81-1496(+)